MHRHSLADTFSAWRRWQLQRDEFRTSHAFKRPVPISSNSLLLSAPVIHVICAYLEPRSLCALCACCHETWNHEAIPLELESYSMPADRALQLASRMKRRFLISSLAVENCSESALRQLTSLLTLQSLRIGTPCAAGASLESLEALSGARSLRSLRLTHAVGKSLNSLAGLSQCPALTSLIIHNCSSLTSLEPLAACARLTSIDLRRCVHLQPHGIAPITKPSSLTVWKLENLTLQGCRALCDVAMLAKCSKLTHLDLSLCDRLIEVDALSCCSKLQTLVLTGCTALSQVEGLSECPALQVLYLSGCPRITDVSTLARLTDLRVLHLNKCIGVTDVSELGKCTSLQLLNLRSSGATVVPHRSGLRVDFGS